MSGVNDRIKEAVKAYRPGESLFPNCNEDRTALYSISNRDDYNTVIDPVEFTTPLQLRLGNAITTIVYLITTLATVY